MQLLNKRKILVTIAQRTHRSGNPSNYNNPQEIPPLVATEISVAMKLTLRRGGRRRSIRHPRINSRQSIQRRSVKLVNQPRVIDARQQNFGISTRFPQRCASSELQQVCRPATTIAAAIISAATLMNTFHARRSPRRTCDELPGGTAERRR